MKKRYLITGGAGFIGSNAADYFLQKNNQVTIFDNFSRKGAEKNIKWLLQKYKSSGNLKIIKGDVADVKNLKKLIKLADATDYVLHLAAQVAVTTSVINPRNDFENNIIGTFNVLEAIRLSKKRPSLIYASTNKVYGCLEEIATVEEKTYYRFRDIDGVSEKQNLDFHSPYGVSKGSADQYVRDYARIYGLKTVVCRQSCIYGTRQFGVEDQGWVAWFMIAAQTNKKITLYGNGKQVRDLLFVTDLVELYDKLFKSINLVSGKIFNVGGGPKNTLSLIELLDMIEKKIGKKLNIKKGLTRPGDQPIYISDIALLKKTIGWVPKIDVKHGTELLWKWIHENLDLF